MSDRQPVYYKTSLHRIAEIALVLLIALAVAALWHQNFPDISARYAVMAALVLGLLLVPVLGNGWAARLGAQRMTASERDNRYLSEIIPLGLAARPLPARTRGMPTGQSRRSVRGGFDRRLRRG